MKNKKILALLLTVALIVSMLPAMAFAAPIDTHKFVLVMGTKAFEQRAINAANKDAIRQALVANGNKFHWVRGDGKIVDSRGQFVDPATMPKDITLTKVDGTTEIINESGSTPIGDLKVLEISAINKTSITVLLSKDPQQAVPASFFRVEGAKLVSVAPGTFSAEKFPYELTIESLDGKKGTVKVNGMSKEYNFETELKAKVESVTFDNYRQFHVTFSEEVDVETAIDPKNYYFEIVEGQAGDKLGAAALNENNSLDAIKDSGASNIVVPNTAPAVPWFGFSNKEKTERHNISAAVENGKTVVTINMPERARFANVAAEVLEANLPAGGKKTLSKDATVFVAVRNVKDKEKKRKIDTAVFPMVIKDEKAPTPLNGSRQPQEKKFENFEFGTANTIEIPILGTEKDKKTFVFINFDEPVRNSGKLYVNGKEVTITEHILAFEKSDGTAESTYKAASRVKLMLNSDGNGDGTADANGAIPQGEFKSGNVFNIKIVGVKDLAENVAVPSVVEFNVKLVGAELPEAEKAEVIGAVQVADNIIEVEWNKAGAKPQASQVRILNLDGTEEVNAASVKYAEISAFPGALGTGQSAESDPDNRPGRYFSYFVVNSTDDPATDAATTLDYQGQEFLLRKLEIKKLVAGGVNNDTFSLDLDIKFTKDVSAPVFEKAEINSLLNPPKTYQEVKAGGEKFVIKMDEIVPYQKGVGGVEYPIFVMKDDGSAVTTNGSAPTDKPKEIRVSYEKDGITRSTVVQPANGWGAQIGADDSLTGDTLTIDLADPAYHAVLNEDHKLVEGATYLIEFPAGYFADHKKDSPADKQHYIDEKRDANYGFLSLPFTVKLTVPGAAEESSDLVPQTSKQLIKVISQPSVNREEVEVQFTGSIDPETIKDPSNYTLNGKTLAAWGATSADIKYVIDGPNEVTAKKYARFFTPVGSVDVTGDVEITVENVANKMGAKMTPVMHKLALRDNTAPKVITAKVQGSQEITLTFDEELAAVESVVAAKNFVATVDGKLMGVVKATLQTNKRVLILELADHIQSGSAVELKVVKDQNGDIKVTDKGDGSGHYTNALLEGTVIKVQ